MAKWWCVLCCWSVVSSLKLLVDEHCKVQRLKRQMSHKTNAPAVQLSLDLPFCIDEPRQRCLHCHLLCNSTWAAHLFFKWQEQARVATATTKVFW